jgi:hypothetical protein
LDAARPAIAAHVSRGFTILHTVSFILQAGVVMVVPSAGSAQTAGLEYIPAGTFENGFPTTFTRVVSTTLKPVFDPATPWKNGKPPDLPTSAFS